MSSKPTVNSRHGSAVITLPSDTEILITRAFDAPAELVFKAFTTPELVRQWWGFETSEWLVCEIDLRVGGPHRLVSTEVYEGFPDAGSLNLMTLDEVDGVTTMTTLVQHETQEHRDMQLASGMEAGMQVSYDRLEAAVRAG